MITSTAAREYFDVALPERVVIEVDVGAGELIAVQAPIALSPSSPETLSAAAPALPAATRDQIENDVNSLFLVLGIGSLVVGAIGIANVTLVTVMERTPEIGLRRAVGARRRHIAAQFLGESTAIGLVGGVIGAAIGLLIIVGVSAVNGWTPVLDAWMPLAAPPVGAVVGLIAGLYPPPAPPAWNPSTPSGARCSEGEPRWGSRGRTSPNARSSSSRIGTRTGRSSDPLPASPV